MKKRVGKIKGFTINFMPYSEISGLDSAKRVRKILDVILSNSILILQGRLRPEEETRLIEDTMAMIGHVKDFKGVELAVISGGNESAFGKVRMGIVNALSGRDLGAVTIIGPATIVKEIKRNPKKIELLLNR
ncbi:MAG: DUF2073 domain-containing protein [Nanoarchaeota archaeon]